MHNEADVMFVWFAGGAMSNHLDISTRISGILYGLTNSCATVTGICGVSMSATLLDWGYTWSAIFDMWACLYVVAAIVFNVAGRTDKIFA